VSLRKPFAPWRERLRHFVAFAPGDLNVFGMDSQKGAENLRGLLQPLGATMISILAGLSLAFLSSKSA
jgi:hypothetical protein